jgi:hypothetical protein
VPLSSFPGLLQTFLNKYPSTPGIEKLGAALAERDFPEKETTEFVRKVCEWGEYPGVAGRVLKRNSTQDIFVPIISHDETEAARLHEEFNGAVNVQ